MLKIETRHEDHAHIVVDTIGTAAVVLNAISDERARAGRPPVHATLYQFNARGWKCDCSYEPRSEGAQEHRYMAVDVVPY
jgi:hypothetical protein